MEEPRQDLEYQEPKEEQGGIRRRLRDRELLKRKKAEAEEKETNQWVFGEESPRKRARAEKKGSTGRRGRPRKSETLEIPGEEEEEASLAEPAPVVLPASEGLQTPEAPTISGDPSPLPVQGSVLSGIVAPVGPTPDFGSPSPVRYIPILVDPVPIATVPLDATPALAPPSAVTVDADPVAQVPVDAPPSSVPDASPSITSPPQSQEPLLVLDEASAVPQVVAAPPSTASSQDPVLIEDVGPSETEDFPQTQEDKVDEDVTSLNNTTEMFFMQPSSLPQQQEYLSGN